MGLLWMDYEAEFRALVEAAFQQECEDHPAYYAALSQRVRDIIYRDTRFNIDFLYTAYLLEDEKIMADYGRWLYQLLEPLFKDQTPEETARYVVEHLATIQKCVPKVVGADKHEMLIHLLECAKESIRTEVEHKGSVQPRISKYEAEIEQYMSSLLQKNTRKTMFLVQEFLHKGIPINDVYVEILAESMRRVGELWHTAKTTVDTEHYCTSVTQMAMAQMYPMLFASERKNKTLLCACPGTELHEMGARMVADLFENDGWDSIYLGAAVPEEYLLKAVEENKPDLVALSVTMPQHLIACQNLVEAIRRKFPEMKIAVGGKAFESTDAIWTKWPIDLYTTDARQLLARANEIC